MSHAGIEEYSQTQDPVTLVLYNSDELECLTENVVSDSVNESPKTSFPIFMVVISVIQAFVFYVGAELGGYSWLYLCYDPYRRHEVYRLLTVMFTHSSREHLKRNVIGQLILGIPLEINHHWKRVGLIYLGGVLGGSLFATLFTPYAYAYGIGASAGVYALLFSHLAISVHNLNQMNKNSCQIIWLLEFIYNQLGLHAGHIGGALTGFCISMLVLKNLDEIPWRNRLQKICRRVLIGAAIFITIINIGAPKYYPPEFNTDYKGTYFKRVFSVIDYYDDGLNYSSHCSKSPLLIECLGNKECANAWARYKMLGDEN